MIRRSLLGLAAATAIAAPAMAQQYPSQTVTLIIPFAAGGPTDALARILSEPLSRELGGTVVVENVGGAGGTIGANRVATARPDGHMLLIHNIGMSTAPTLYRRMPYNVLTDFETIGLLAPVPMVWTVRPDFPGNTLPEMLAYIRERREGVNLANAGLGSASQLCGTLLQAELHQAVTAVVFRGTGPAFADLISGRIDIMCDQTTSTMPHIQGGRIKAVATTSAARLPQLPEVPTAREQGLNFEISVWHGMYAPRGTPAPVVARINGALRAALRDPRLIQRFAELGTAPEPEARVTPAAHRAFLEAEIARWRPILQAAGEYAD